MRPYFHFAFRAAVPAAAARTALIAALFSAILLGSAIARADDAPSGAVGRVTGKDISVGGGVGESGQATVAPSIYVSNGNVVTVHSGKARMTLFAGGKLEICGPAKFTVLRSGESITIALNFGHVRADLPAKTSLRIFTPTIVGTPIDISGGSRDVTVGLNLDDSLCVLATSGAIQLEHQFSGEKIIVPETGEFFLSAGKLLPVAGTPGSCQCLADEQQEVPTPTQPGIEFATAVSETPARNAAPAEQPSEGAPAIEYSVLERGNQAHPLVASAKIAVPAAPPVPAGSGSIMMPALEFMAGTPLPRPGPPEELLVLVREARVSSEWKFSGRVKPPDFAAAMQHALGEKPVTPQTNVREPSQPPAQGQKKKGGFWAALKRAFGGA
jgi:hypothetical protein